MPREIGPEWEYFGGSDGLVSETCNGKTKYFWRCQYCNFALGGKHFQNEKACIHLSGDPQLRNGQISVVCSSAPQDVKLQFGELVRSKRKEKEENRMRQKRKSALLNSKVVTNVKQSKLRLSPAKLGDNQVDEAWATAFFALDIPANKISHTLFREAIAATQRSRVGYVCSMYVTCKQRVLTWTKLKLLLICYARYKGPDRHKLFGKILDSLHSKCTVEQKAFLDRRSGYGRAMTGDGATILGTKFMNFLCHEYGKGAMLCSIKDCTPRLQEVGAIEATYIAHNMLEAIRFVFRLIFLMHSLSLSEYITVMYATSP